MRSGGIEVQRLSMVTVGRLGAVAVLMLGLLPGALDYWTYQIGAKPHYGFALLVPPVVVWLAWMRWGSIARHPCGGRAWALALYGLAFVALGLWGWAVSSTLWAISVLLLAVALTYDVSGVQGLWLLAPALALVALAIPLPLGLDHWAVFRLQLVASQTASWMLDGIWRVDHLRDGNVLHVAGCVAVAGLIGGMGVTLQHQRDPARTMGDRLGSLERRFPVNWHGWARTRFQDKKDGTPFAKALRTQIFGYASGPGTLEVYVHYPYAEWHVLEDCYRGTGQDVQFVEGGRDAGFPYVTFTARADAGKWSRIAYTCVDPFRGVTPVPITQHLATLALFEAVASRWEEARAPLHAAALVLVLTGAGAEMDTRKREAVALLGDARKWLITQAGTH